MTMSEFYKHLGPISYQDIALSLNIENKEIKNNINKTKFSSFKGLDSCDSNDLSFLYDNYKLNKLNNLPKGILISKYRKDPIDIDNIIQIKVDNIHLAIAKISNIFYRDFLIDEKKRLKKSIIHNKEYISKHACIGNNCKIGKNLSIENGSIIKEGCNIGNNVKIGSNSIIQNSIIGDNVEIESNCSIGQPGFGFAFNNSGNEKIFHIGRVLIQDNVYIGSNCTIDRGSFSDTFIGENTYIDNQVHIAHNVSIGLSSAIAGQCGIAGSTKIGNFVKIGGQVGISGHLKIGDFVEIAAKSGVRSNIENKQKVMGDPAINMYSYLKRYKKMFN